MNLLLLGMKLSVIFIAILSLFIAKSCEGFPSSPGDQQGRSDVQTFDTYIDVTEIVVEIPESDEDFILSKSTRPTSSCTDPSFELGTCTPLSDCPYLLEFALLPHSRKEYKLLQKSFCGKFGVRVQLFCCKNENIVRKQNIQSPIKPLPANLKPRKGCQSSATINSKYCGNTLRIFDRVKNGHPAPEGAWPWAALLGTDIGNPSFSGCGGALITDRHVLTAAHCLKDKTENNLFVRLGEHNLTTNRDGKTSDIPVSKITRHPKYNGEFHDDDIAILHLAAGVCFKDRITPVCVPETWWNALDLAGSNVWVIGWGLDDFAGRRTDVLHEAEIQISVDSSCRHAYRNDKQIRSFDGVLCAAGLNGKDACQGDSGNALNFRKENGRVYAVGVVSFGNGCGKEGFPGVYTKTSKYYEWIRQTTLSV